MNPLVIIGSGGYAQELLWIVDELNDIEVRASHKPWDFRGFIDPANPFKRGRMHYDRPVLGGWEAIERLPRDTRFACGIGAPEARRKECIEAERQGLLPATLIFPNVALARHVEIGEGTVIGPGATLGPYARLGRHCALNLHANVGHNACVGDFSVLCPGAQVLGGAVLEEGAFIGTNATVFQGRRVGAGAKLAANSLLVSDLGPGRSAMGVPASSFFKTQVAGASITQDSRQNIQGTQTR